MGSSRIGSHLPRNHWHEETGQVTYASARARALKDEFAKHGISYEFSGNCSTTAEEQGRMAGYQAIMVAEINVRFGADFISVISAQAEAKASRISRSK